MNYPYSVLETQLQFLCTPAEYERIAQQPYRRNPEYAKIIPFYTYAYCPFCGMQHYAQINTYHLNGNSGGQLIEPFPIYHPTESAQKRCKHFFGTHKFLNLHGLIPGEADYLNNSEGEVPYLTATLFLENIPTKAVLHGLPICRIIEDAFVPSYTLFILTYFSENPKGLLEARYASQTGFTEVDPDYYPAVFQPAGFVTSNSYNLPQAVQDGKLAWLDPHNPNLTLQADPYKPLAAIYASIPGNRQPTIWQQGKQIQFDQAAVRQLALSTKSNKVIWTSQSIFIREFRRIILHSLMLHLLLLFQFLFAESLLNIPFFAAFMYCDFLFFSVLIFRGHYGAFLQMIPASTYRPIRWAYKTLAIGIPLLMVSYVLGLVLHNKTIYPISSFFICSVTGIMTLLASAGSAGATLRYGLTLHKRHLFPETNVKMRPK